MKSTIRYTITMKRTVLAALTLGLIPQFVFASLLTMTTVDGWEKAKTIRPYASEQVVFGKLSQPLQSHFLTWENEGSHQVRITIAVPESASSDFHPRLALFEPSDEMIGPLLPMDQPPKTLAAIYPANNDQAVFEGLTQTQYTVRLALDLTLEKSGQYYLAVYNADDVAGTYRLTITPPETDVWTAVTAYPGRWWTSHAWAGLSIRTLFLPAVVIGTLSALCWFIMLRLKTPIVTRKPK